MDIWQDKEMRFDVPAKMLALKDGERAIDVMHEVEDTKDNSGRKGSLVVTNLRLIWKAENRRRHNLSIGYGCLVGLNMKAANSRIRGKTQSLFVQAKTVDSRFEFIFTHLTKSGSRLFTTVQAVFRAYDTSRMYRDLRLRAALVQASDLKLLPRENLVNRHLNVWNLSEDEGSIGTMYTTSHRVAWHSNRAESFNVSIPHISISRAVAKESKFGPAVIIVTTPRVGGYRLGFRLNDESKIDDVVHEINVLMQAAKNNPDLGVQSQVEQDRADTSLESRKVTPAVLEGEDDSVFSQDEGGDAFAAYFADPSSRTSDRDVVFSHELGLAIEEPPRDASLSSLWQVI